MIKLLKAEYMKTKRCHIFLVALSITFISVFWSLYDINFDFAIQNGWMMILYQSPIINALFLPLLSTIIASQIGGIEHKGQMLKRLCTIFERKSIFNAKMIYGLVILSACTILMFLAKIIYGIYIGFGDIFPLHLYLLSLLLSLIPTLVIFIFQYSLSMNFNNQAVTFFAGIIGEFIGLFSMFVPQIPILRKSIIWGYYGALQFVDLFGWTKETRYENATIEQIPLDWSAFAIIIILGIAIYFIGQYYFKRKEL